MRIPKLSLIVKINEDLTKISMVNGKAQFLKSQGKYESNF